MNSFGVRTSAGDALPMRIQRRHDGSRCGVSLIDVLPGYLRADTARDGEGDALARLRLSKVRE